MIYCRIYMSLTVCLLLSILLLLYWASGQVKVAEQEQLPARRALVRSLQLTDLAVWTEARYTRHPSQADLFSPFQEFPAAPEHFPAGSLLVPPSPGKGHELRIIRKERPAL